MEGFGDEDVVSEDGCKKSLRKNAGGIARTRKPLLKTGDISFCLSVDVVSW